MKRSATLFLCLVTGFMAFQGIHAQTQRIFHDVLKPSPITKTNIPIPFLAPQNILAATDQISYFDPDTSNRIFYRLPYWPDDTTSYTGYGERFTCSTLTNFTVDSVEFVYAPVAFEARKGNKILLTLHKRGPDFPQPPLAGNPYANFTWIDTAQVLATNVTQGQFATDTVIPFLKKTKTKFFKSSPDFWIYAKLPDTTNNDVRILLDATTDDQNNHTTMGGTQSLPDGDRSYVWFNTASGLVYQGFLGGRFQNTQTQGIYYNQLVMRAYVSGTSLGVIEDLTGNALAQNYPNPFTPSTEIWYSLANDSRVSLKVYNALGLEVATLANDYEPSGDHHVNFNSDHLPSGTYFYTLKAGTFSQTKRMVLAK